MVTHPVRRTFASAVVTLALVAVLLLVPDAVSVYATNMMGSLRAPGEPAFIAGHRGDRANAPENTMAAFEAAFASGLEFVETDVQLTSDGVPILMHDETVDRTTNGTGAVADLTLAEIRALDAGSWYAPEFAGTQVPLFDEFADALTGTRKKALVELKGYWTPDGIRTILDAIYLRGVQNRIVFASFNLTTIAHLAHTAPAIPRVIIKRDLPEDPVALVRYYDAIAILTTPTSLENDPQAVDSLHAAGLGVLVYTLNSEKRWSEALDYGVDGIVTDKPSKLDGWIAKTAPGT
jgi:glycerophosphoryl diester phosphodiesterase